MGFVLMLNLILLVLIIVFIFKYMLVNFKLSESFLRNAIIIILLCICGYLAFYGAFTSLYIGQTKNSVKYQLTQDISKEERKEIERGVESLKKDEGMAIVLTASGWIIFGIADIIQRKYLIKAAQKPGKGKWNLEDYK